MESLSIQISHPFFLCLSLLILGRDSEFILFLLFTFPFLIFLSGAVISSFLNREFCWSFSSNYYYHSILLVSYPYYVFFGSKKVDQAMCFLNMDTPTRLRAVCRPSELRARRASLSIFVSFFFFFPFLSIDSNR